MTIRGRRRTPGRRALLAVGVAAVGVLAAGCGGGPEWFSAPTTRAGGADRQAAYGTGYGNEGDMGNAVAGNCPTRFAYRWMRVRIEVSADSSEAVVAFFPGTDGTVERIAPGAGHTWSLDKGVGHCKFAGPAGEMDLVDGPVRVATAEGYTNKYSGNTSVSVTLDGVEHKLAEGGSATVGPVEIRRPTDPETRTAEIVLRVRN